MNERAFVFQVENLLSPADALATYLARVPLEPIGTEQVPLEQARGRILSDDISADADYPNAARSAMDGWAVRARDGAMSLRIVGEVAMGSIFRGSIATGEAVRIPTGGVVPDGADAIVPIEDARLDGERVVIVHPAAIGENINPRAGDMRAGDRALTRGTRILAPQLGVLATLGVASVPVFKRPLVAVISSGDELIDPWRVPEPGQIRDSNRFAVGALLEALGCLVRQVPTAADEPGALEAALRTALVGCDAVVLTGGSSVGERDHTPAAISALGGPGVIVHGLRVKPGKPTVLAAIGSKPVIGLPGNPTSAVLILQAVAAPIFAALSGGALPVTEVEATLDSTARGRQGWTWYIPVSLKQEGSSWTAHPLPLRSSTVSVISQAGGFITLPGDREELAAGTRVRVAYFL